MAYNENCVAGAKQVVEEYKNRRKKETDCLNR